jgi:hypothetical protein
VKPKDELLKLAEQHGIETKRRHFIDKRTPAGLKTTFIDLPRPAKDIRDDLVALGVLT